MNSLSISSTASNQLAPQHVNYLKERAVSEAFALAAGLRSATTAEIQDALGLNAPPSSGGMLIPYAHATPAYYRARLDNDDPRFLVPAGRAIPVFIAPAPDGSATDAPLVVVEGPVKALALAELGVTCVALGGVATTLVKGCRQPKLNDTWSSVLLKGRHVIVCFDGNRDTNASVARAEARLTVALERAGAVVSTAELPTGDDGPDDYVAAHGAEALLSLLFMAPPADPVARIAKELEVVA